MTESPRTAYNIIHPAKGIGALTHTILRDFPDDVIKQGVQAETEIFNLRREVERLKRLQKAEGTE